ncbi:GNAT family N-acetyltransferase [Acidimicrobiia bacterium EGI L10123]|uniref:GNAT family N-acetyltransferase n=1 Tax=Salinilacustrithrix flava TaxID=2957203 RepID=UPI003D7C3648|nr:GNAT family N-acetyltransferase [Acidimicrobiia bacterium EGI L10123]
MAVDLTGRTVAVTAERRAEEQADLFRKRGAEVVVATTVHTVDLTGDAALRATTEAVIADPPDWVVATTGFGMRLWFEAADAWDLGDALIRALGTSLVVARGPKAQSACRQRGLEVRWRAPGESMPEVVAWLEAQDGIAGASVVVQLFDPEDHPSTAELVAMADQVTEVPVYRWRRPDDEAPVRDLAHRIARRGVDAVTFTSQPAVRFLLEVAAEEGVLDELVAACNDGIVLPVCVGPVCAEPIAAAGIRTAVWPDPYRLVPMVKLATERLASLGDDSSAIRRDESPTNRSPVRFEEVHPHAPDAQAAMAAYVDELDRRFPTGFDAGDARTGDADALAAPAGAFLIARQDDRVVACGGVQTIGDGVGEIKRMWVAGDVRGQGLGRRLLTELEARSAALGHRLVRLDTNGELTEAIALYEGSGYAEVERYNDNPYAQRFFEKPLP